MTITIIMATTTTIGITIINNHFIYITISKENKSFLKRFLNIKYL